MPVDWLVGWIWNLFPVVLAGTFAAVISNRYGRFIGMCTLIAALLSVAYFDGFAAMYWKTFASLFWCVLAFRAFERRSWLGIPFGILGVATHHQTGLLFGLVFLSWIILAALPFTQSTQTTFLSGKKLSPRLVFMTVGAGAVILIIGILAYLPIWRDAVLTNLPALLGQTEAASGNFPPPLFYVQTEGILLLLGAYGFVQNIRRERWTLWQLSVIWSFLFVALHLLFYRRFFLQLDFFLLPFAGMALADIWTRFATVGARLSLIAVCLVQVALMVNTITLRKPPVSDETLAAAINAGNVVEQDGFILGLDPDSATLLRGWAPDKHVGGPGLFESQWSFDQWKRFLLGSHNERAALIAHMPQPLYVFVSPQFATYYGSYADQFLSDSCFMHTDHPMLYRAACTPKVYAP